MSVPVALVVVVALLACNAFFVAAEFAVTGSRSSRIEPLTKTSRAARQTMWALEHLSAMLAAAQLGVTLCSVALGVVAEPTIAHLIAQPLTAMGLQPALIHTLAFLLGLTIVVFLHVVLGEMVPKNVSVTSPEKAALILVPPLLLFEKLCKPLVVLLNACANGALRLLKVEPKDEVTAAFTAEEVASIVEVSEAAGVLHDENGLISGSLEFTGHCAADTMVPIAEVKTLQVRATAADVEQVVVDTGFSRLLISAEDGEILGYLHVKDVLGTPAKRRNEPISARQIRPLAQVSADDEVETVLAAMRAAGGHLAGVMNAGRVEGIVFLEDIIEELVGEISDVAQHS